MNSANSSIKCFAVRSRHNEWRANPLKIIDGTKLYEVEDLVAMLKVSRVTVQGYLRSARIKGVKIGKRWHVTEKNLKDFLSGDTQGKASWKTGS